MKVGFVGLGNMGAPMAANLVAAGHALSVYNRTASKAAALRDAGATLASSPAEAAEDAEVLLTMLADDAAVEEVLFGGEGAFDALPRGAVHACMGTIGVPFSERLARRHAEAGLGYVAAPVFGRPDAAKAASLFVLAAGPEDAVARCLPLFEAMGQGVFRLGEEAGTANAVKLAGNFAIAAMIETLGEAYALVRKAGLTEDRFLEVVNAALFKSPLYERYGRLVAERRFEPPGFRLALGLKDVRLVLEAGERFEVPLPLASLVHDRFLAAVARGWAGLDWAALARIAERDAGLDPGR